MPCYDVTRICGRQKDAPPSDYPDAKPPGPACACNASHRCSGPATAPAWRQRWRQRCVSLVPHASLALAGKAVLAALHGPVLAVLGINRTYEFEVVVKQGLVLAKGARLAAVAALGRHTRARETCMCARIAHAASVSAEARSHRSTWFASSDVLLGYDLQSTPDVRRWIASLSLVYSAACAFLSFFAFQVSPVPFVFNLSDAQHAVPLSPTPRPTRCLPWRR